MWVILVVIVCVIDFTIGEIVFRVCLLWFVLGVFLIERFWIVYSDCLL